MKPLLPLSIALLLPGTALAGAEEAASTALPLNLMHHAIGYSAIAVTVLAYVAAMSEDRITSVNSIRTAPWR